MEIFFICLVVLAVILVVVWYRTHASEVPKSIPCEHSYTPSSSSPTAGRNAYIEFSNVLRKWGDYMYYLLKAEDDYQPSFYEKTDACGFVWCLCSTCVSGKYENIAFCKEVFGGLLITVTDHIMNDFGVSREEAANELFACSSHYSSKLTNGTTLREIVSVFFNTGNNRNIFGLGSFEILCFVPSKFENKLEQLWLLFSSDGFPKQPPSMDDIYNGTW